MILAREQVATEWYSFSIKIQMVHSEINSISIYLFTFSLLGKL